MPSATTSQVSMVSPPARKRRRDSDEAALQRSFGPAFGGSGDLLPVISNERLIVPSNRGGPPFIDLSSKPLSLPDNIIATLTIIIPHNLPFFRNHSNPISPTLTPIQLPFHPRLSPDSHHTFDQLVGPTRPDFSTPVIYVIENPPGGQTWTPMRITTMAARNSLAEATRKDQTDKDRGGTKGGAFLQVGTGVVTALLFVAAAALSAGVKATSFAWDAWLGWMAPRMGP
ncbi:hypothetical protein GGS20DRAFT_585854 [Poronia punctata]|nr:hypothetical protein GGS20DRAFT_585854 [Poronia punctata]